MTMREKIADAARKFHRESCYPDALDFEVDAFVDAVFDALSDPTPEMLREGAARIRDFYSENGAFPRTKAMFVAAIRKAEEK